MQKTPEQERRRKSLDAFFKELANQSPAHREKSYDAMSEEAKTEWLKGESK
jgi:hypothetical protein